MVMHTLNCTYGGGINHEAESCCCFLGRVAEQIRRCRWSSWAAARLNCQDCCQDSLSSKVHLLGIFSLPWCQRCNADSDTCGKCFVLQTESFSIHSLQNMFPSCHRGWDWCRDFAQVSCPPHVIRLTLTSQEDCAISSHPLGTEQGRRARMILRIWVKKQGWRLVAELGTGPVLLQCWCMFLGGQLCSCKGRRMWDTPPVASGEAIQWGEKWCWAPREERWMHGSQMLHSGFLPWFLVCQWREEWGEEREESTAACVLLGSATCSSPLYE